MQEASGCGRLVGKGRLVCLIRVKSTVTERRQHQLGRMADFPPLVTFSFFD